MHTLDSGPRSCTAIQLSEFGTQGLPYTSRPTFANQALRSGVGRHCRPDLGAVPRSGPMRLAYALLASLALAGCGPRALYNWGKYEDSLYLRYSEQNFGEAETELSQTLPQAGQTGRVPPGVYADYGYMLYRRGDYAGAVAAFEKEKKTFPESSALMAKLIDRVQQKTAPKTEAEKPAEPAAKTEGAD